MKGRDSVMEINKSRLSKISKNSGISKNSRFLDLNYISEKINEEK